MLYEQGTSPDDLQFLLDGRVRSTVDADGHVSQTEIDPPAALAFEEVMEGAPAASTITAVDRAICLAVRSEQVLALLAENPDLVHGLLRMAIERENGEAWRGVMRAAVGPVEGGAVDRPAAAG